jgi:hypothetical protein
VIPIRFTESGVRSGSILATVDVRKVQQPRRRQSLFDSMLENNTGEAEQSQQA